LQVDRDEPGSALTGGHLEDFYRFSEAMTDLSVAATAASSGTVFEEGVTFGYDHMCVRRVLADGVAMPCERYSALDCYEEGR